MGGFLWSDSFVCARGRWWLYVLFVGGLVLGPYGLRIPGVGGDHCVYVRIVSGCVCLSQQPMIYGCSF